MDKSKYKGAVFFDIDGTLMDIDMGIKEPPKSVYKAVDRLKKNGYLTGIATGRGINYLPDVVYDFNFDTVITCNGAEVYYGEIKIVDDVIPNDVLCRAVRYLDDKECLYFIAEGGKSFFNGKENKRFYWIDKEIYPLSECDHKITEMRANKIYSSYTKEIAKEFSDIFADSLTTLVHRRNMESTAFGITKASGIMKAIKYFNISIQNTYAFGNDTNDIEMIREIGHGIAMGESVPELFKTAEYVTDKIEDDGIYNALKHYKLI